MGRTIRPVRYEVEAQLKELEGFVRALRAQDRIYFNKLYVDVKKHISSITYANTLNPNELMQWAALIELEKKVEKLRMEIRQLM